MLKMINALNPLVLRHALGTLNPPWAAL